MRSAVVDLASQIVVNIIVADASVDEAPTGTVLIDVTNTPCGIGWIYDPISGGFSPPETN